MNTITNRALACPARHVWCEGHSSGDDHRLHIRRESLRAGGQAIDLALTLDEGCDEPMPAVRFDLAGVVVSFEQLEELANIGTAMSAIAARLTWFTVGLEALAGFEFSVDEEPGEPDQLMWELPCAGTDYRHSIVFDVDHGWRMRPASPADVLPLGNHLSWCNEVETLRVAMEFLREVFQATGAPA